ncbi:glucosamine-6-phosphate isomerase [Kipferlia bialata]|uniref:glucosamine-6-phosphate deaminase n=1 Tax=Kipferlia bialata TaxID=797122 RepID=A0A9K3CQ51_9EUKA|nr:glucosamine-6-phosphate isomerase [Kipferlia bialata]|eukprot:g1506.t1
MPGLDTTVPGMQLVKCASKDAAGQYISDMFVGLVNAKPEAVLGFATGSSPLPTYRAMIAAYAEKKVDFSRCTSYNLDEYVGLPEGHPETYSAFMQANLFDSINLPSESVHVPAGCVPKGGEPLTPAEVDTLGDRYEADLERDGPVDLWLLGVGHNGHIAFNEPGSAADSRTRLVHLDAGTIEANKRFFDNDPSLVPTSAVSVGVGTILASRRIVLVAGPEKAEAVARMMDRSLGPDASCPASFLQTHPDVVVVTY